MRSGDALIRLAKNRIEGVRKLIAAAEASRADLERQRAQIDANEQAEFAFAARAPEAAAAAASYAQALAMRRRNVERSLDGVAHELDSLSEELRTAFEELKRLEILEERRKAREAAAVMKREQALLDEAASLRARRR
jgi:flagellar export protein FliJ